MTATLERPAVPAVPAIPQLEIPREGPYKVLFERLQRLVRYRSDLVQTLALDPGNGHATAELVRIRHMIKEVHRGVSLSLDAKLLAQRLDPEF
ncbi:MAG TPA: hypothetical protein VFN74_06635 [Chloroflexota bacterium]|nr:hypothetical protein [Chloroflexota bacterium]